MQRIAWQKPVPLAHQATAARPSSGSFSSHLQRSIPAESGLSCRSKTAVSSLGPCGRTDLQPEASTSGRNVWQSTHSSRHSFFISNRTQAAPAASTSADASTDAASSLPELPLPNLPVRGKGLGSLALRTIFGTILGLLGAVVITAGGWLFTGAVCLVAYQATQEFFGFVTCKGVAEGQSPPSPIVSALTTAMCLGLSIWTHITHGRATAALAVASFAVLAVHVSLTEKPTTAQLASAVFGLFYCGRPSLILWRMACPCLNRHALYHCKPQTHFGEYSTGLSSIFASLQATCQASGSNCDCLAHQQFTVRLSMTGRYVQRHRTLCLLLGRHILRIAPAVDRLFPCFMSAASAGAIWRSQPLDSWPGCHVHGSCMCHCSRHRSILLWQVIWENTTDQD